MRKTNIAGLLIIIFITSLLSVLLMSRVIKIPCGPCEQPKWWYTCTEGTGVSRDGKKSKMCKSKKKINKKIRKALLILKKYSSGELVKEINDTISTVTKSVYDTVEDIKKHYDSFMIIVRETKNIGEHFMNKVRDEINIMIDAYKVFNKDFCKSVAEWYPKISAKYTVKTLEYILLGHYKVLWELIKDKRKEIQTSFEQFMNDDISKPVKKLTELLGLVGSKLAQVFQPITSVIGKIVKIFHNFNKDVLLAFQNLNVPFPDIRMTKVKPFEGVEKISPITPEKQKGCPPEMVRTGGICLPKCEEGYEPVLGEVICRKVGCPSRTYENLLGTGCTKVADKGRGVGYIPHRRPCVGNEVDHGLLCYKPIESKLRPRSCGTGWQSKGCLCVKKSSWGVHWDSKVPDKWHNCGSGWSQTACHCGRGGTSYVKEMYCNDGDELWGALCYPKCGSVLPDSHNVGCCMCHRSVNCPSGWTDTGVECLKNTYDQIGLWLEGVALLALQDVKNLLAEIFNEMATPINLLLDLEIELPLPQLVDRKPFEALLRPITIPLVNFTTNLMNGINSTDSKLNELKNVSKTPNLTDVDLTRGITILDDAISDMRVTVTKQVEKLAEKQDIKPVCDVITNAPFIKSLMDAVDGVVKSVTGFISVFTDMIFRLIEGVKKLIEDTVDLVTMLWDSVKDTVFKLLEHIKTVFSEILRTVQTFGYDISEVMEDAVGIATHTLIEFIPKGKMLIVCCCLMFYTTISMYYSDDYFVLYS